VAKGGGLWAQKWCESKPPLTAPQSCAYIESNPRAMHYIPLGVNPHPESDKRSVNEKGVVVETLTHCINRRHGGSGCGEKNFSLRYHDGRFFL
jgi:hypothetical protein